MIIAESTKAFNRVLYYKFIFCFLIQSQDAVSLQSQQLLILCLQVHGDVPASQTMEMFALYALLVFFTAHIILKLMLF